jgi:transcriptional regulator with XRE-family HTH domain
MKSALGPAIREARRAAGLTQEQLGRRLGLEGRAIYRWERSESAPTKRHRSALVTAIQAVNQGAAAKLATAMMNAGVTNVPAIAQPPSPTPVENTTALELAVFAMADELDLPPRRIRGSLVRLCQRLRTANYASVEGAQSRLELWIANTQ